MSVIPFNLSPASALKIIRASANTTRTRIPPRLAKDDWPHVVLRRQVIRCLEAGEVTNSPAPNALGHWEYQMERIDSGQEIFITVVLRKNDENDWIVTVTEVTNGEY